MGDASEESNRGSWIRSLEDMDEDLLHVFEYGKLTDCSFKVGRDEDDFKVFKCHKLILSVASSVFEAMLYGNFNDAAKGPDDPITLEDTDPSVFEAAMKYIYGKKEAFEDVTMALDLYKFAHKMQISSLESSIKIFLNDELTPSNSLAIYDLLKMTGTDAEIDKLQEAFLEDSGAAFESAHWLDVSADSVEIVLQMDEINLNEFDIFKALIRWGKAQVEFDDEDELYLREQVRPFLKLIRFESMQPARVAEACKMTKALTAEEQRSVLLAAVTGDVGDLPEEWGVEEIRPARSLSVFVQLDYTVDPTVTNIYTSSSRFSFQVEKEMHLVSFEMSNHAVILDSSKSIFLFDAAGEIMAQFRVTQGLDYGKIGTNRALQPGNMYSLKRDSDFEVANCCVCTPTIKSGADLISGMAGTYLPVYELHFKVV